MTTSRAVAWSLGWIGAGLALGLVVLAAGDTGWATNYLTVYLVERSLSLDNLFLFLIIFGAFAVPAGAQRRTLIAGVLLALLLRGVAIALGAQLLERFSWISYLLGALLLSVAVRVARDRDDEAFDAQNMRAVRFARRRLPITDDLAAERFLVRREGRWMGTPLVLALGAVAVADITFAVDSIPAAFAITTDATAIWAANAAALLGLTSLFVLVRALVQRFRFMRQTLAAILAFIALRLLAEEVVHLGPAASLAGVLGILAAGVALSLLADRRSPPAPLERALRRPPRCPPAPEGALPVAVVAGSGGAVGEPADERAAGTARGLADGDAQHGAARAGGGPADEEHRQDDRGGDERRVQEEHED